MSGGRHSTGRTSGLLAKSRKRVHMHVHTGRNGTRMFPVFADSLLSLDTKEARENSNILSCSAPFCKSQTWKVSHPKLQCAMIHSSLVFICDDVSQCAS